MRQVNFSVVRLKKYDLIQQGGGSSHLISVYKQIHEIKRLIYKRFLPYLLFSGRQQAERHINETVNHENSEMEQVVVLPLQLLIAATAGDENCSFIHEPLNNPAPNLNLAGLSDSEG